MGWANTEPSPPPPHREPRGPAEWLHHDIEHHAHAIGATWSRDDIAKAIGLPANRAQRLRAWLIRNGQTPVAQPAGGYDDVALRAPRGTVERRKGRLRLEGDTSLTYRSALDLQLAPRRHLVIGDSHNRADADPEHWVWLSRMVADLRPDVVVNIGDHYDNEALSRHNNPSQREGQRVMADIEAGNQALALFHSKLPADYAPDLHWTEGNHDAYIQRIAADHPHLAGLVDREEAYDFTRHGWATHDYQVPAEIDGVTYCHNMTRAGSGRPIGGMYQAKSMLVENPSRRSIVVGHSHVYKYYQQGDPRPGSPKRHGVVAGCFFRHHADYAGQSNGHWWRGIVVLEHVRDGDFDPVPWSMDRIRHCYGGGA